jgi:phenylacetate-coenzyme A ligase PaaK-like adenylate-forming protein
MITYDQLLALAPYSLGKQSKRLVFAEFLHGLTKHHYAKCYEYKKILDAMGVKPEAIFDIDRMPFLPVSLFKEFNLKSSDDGEPLKTMTSSGTSGQQLSKIYLDRETSSLQTKALIKIVSSFLSKKRIPMIVLDKPETLSQLGSMTARGAGIQGFSIFAREKIFAFDNNMNIDLDALEAFISKHANTEILLFGFTFVIWQYFIQVLKINKQRLNLARGVLVHGGGWKKLADQQVNAQVFKRTLNEVCGLTNIHDYYGMVEQMGSIYMECEYGFLHASIFSDVIVRNAEDFSVADVGDKGLIQVISVLPRSYPGHSLLTEDEGLIVGEDDCQCGRLGKYFQVVGRAKNSELRGCSDTRTF